MFVPLLLTLHVWQAPPLRPPALDPVELASVIPAPLVLDALLAQAPQLADPHAGSFSGAEVAAGAAGSIVGSAAAIAGSLVIALAACAVDNSHSEIPACVVWGMLAWGVGELALPPLFTAAGANLASSNPLAGSFGRAVGYAYAAEGLGLVGSIVLGVASEAAFRNSGGAVFLLSFALVQLLAMPIAASYGLHDGATVAVNPAKPGPAQLTPEAPPPPQFAPPPSYTPEAPPPPVTVPPPPMTFNFAVPF